MSETVFCKYGKIKILCHCKGISISEVGQIGFDIKQRIKCKCFREKLEKQLKAPKEQD